MGNKIGKRYVCESCGAEVLVTRGGDGELACCGKPMQERGATASRPQAAEREVHDA